MTRTHDNPRKFNVCRRGGLEEGRERMITQITNCTWAALANVCGIYAMHKVTLAVSAPGDGVVVV